MKRDFLEKPWSFEFEMVSLSLVWVRISSIFTIMMWTITNHWFGTNEEGLWHWIRSADVMIVNCCFTDILPLIQSFQWTNYTAAFSTKSTKKLIDEQVNDNRKVTKIRSDQSLRQSMLVSSNTNIWTKSFWAEHFYRCTNMSRLCVSC